MSADAGISVRTRFERFPATVKGAFILRGEDRYPHQVVFREARVVPVGGGAGRPVAVPAGALDVAPHRDVFVPFELGVSDLEPGWYGLQCALEVDGSRRTFEGDRRFAVAWPRATVRRGQVRVDRQVPLGDSKIRVEHVDCGGESIRIMIQVQPPGPFTVRLFADEARLEVLDVEVEEATGRGRVTAYPIPKAATALRMELKGKGRGAEASLDVRLP